MMENSNDIFQEDIENGNAATILLNIHDKQENDLTQIPNKKCKQSKISNNKNDLISNSN